MIGRVEETSASFEARSAPRLYPTEGLGVKFPGPTRHKPRMRSGPGASLCPQYLQSRRDFVHRSERRRCQLRASKPYSITLSARANSEEATVRPSASAVLSLIINSYFVAG